MDRSAVPRRGWARPETRCSGRHIGEISCPTRGRAWGAAPVLFTLDSPFLMRARLDPSAPVPAAGTIQVEVLVFGQLVELLSTSSLSVRLPRPATALDVLHSVLATLPGPAPSIPPLAFAVNRAHSTPDAAVEDGDEVALLPPLAGG